MKGNRKSCPLVLYGFFLADKLCDTVQALEYIRQAKSLPAGQDLRDAICVFDIYLQAKSVEKYDADFENYLYNELSWLDQKLVMNLDSDTKEWIINSGIKTTSVVTAYIIGMI